LRSGQNPAPIRRLYQCVIFALHIDTKAAIAAVSVPHLAGSAVRFWLLRAKLDRTFLWNFGLTSAGEGLTGALLHAWASSSALAIVFGMLLVFAGPFSCPADGASAGP
jgi:uncharacterized membrane protein YfcA